LVRQTGQHLVPAAKCLVLLLIMAFLLVVGCERGGSVPDIEPLVTYARQFSPCTADGDCRNLYRTPDGIRDILEKYDMTFAYNASVMLVLLRHYNHEYAKFHQGYEIREGVFHEQSAFVSAFMRITGEGGGDHMTARAAYDWVRSHPEYLEDELIAKEMRKVRETERRIEEVP
jgi:hypothetical protein